MSIIYGFGSNLFKQISDSIIETDSNSSNSLICSPTQIQLPISHCCYVSTSWMTSFFIGMIFFVIFYLFLSQSFFSKNNKKMRMEKLFGKDSLSKIKRSMNSFLQSGNYFHC